MTEAGEAKTLGEHIDTLREEDRDAAEVLFLLGFGEAFRAMQELGLSFLQQIEKDQLKVLTEGLFNKLWAGRENK
jgi:hypothetical protein